jgi:transcriptional regulator with XRE-family HTH domain
MGGNDNREDRQMRTTSKCVMTGVFGRRLKALRERARWTKSELAIRAGVSRPHLVHLERGEREPSYAVACALSDALCVPLESFRT